MGFNTGREKKQFDQTWAKLEKEYEAAGMSADAIQEIHRFDIDMFFNCRRFRRRTQTLPESFLSGECEKSTLIKRYEALTDTFDEGDFPGRYSWTDTIEDQRLVAGLKQLGEKELELLTYLVIEEHSQAELAKLWGCSQRAISKKFQKIRNIF